MGRVISRDDGLTVPAGAPGIVIFAHGSGSSRHSPRNQAVASMLNDAGLGTYLLDLLTPAEEANRANIFDIELLASRLTAAAATLRRDHAIPFGFFGASTGAAAALWAAAAPGADVAAIVSRGGRPDLAGPRLGHVRAPTLLIVGGRDEAVLELNREAQDQLRCRNELLIVPGATHLFEEEGTLDTVAALAQGWFVEHLSSASPPLEVEAWAPTMEACLVAAAEGLVSTFADVEHVRPEGTVSFTCDPGSDPELLVSVLDEVIYVVDAQDLIPVHVELARTGDGGLAGSFEVAPRAGVPTAGPVPRSVTHDGLHLDHTAGGWRATVVVDV